ncbi:MAG: toxin-antitoxin system HicB family antitoxin [Niveispirillum sp.]|uniref:toxin-antitoxin system HicB family antitoxin n=1 Tax=Niveispirillum sp. TaxID=1917217 RepID=UPI003BA71C2A
MKMKQSTFPLRLPSSIKAEVERRAREDGISINQFIATAAAEKLSAMNTADFFAERRARADFDAFDRIMNREGGQPPAQGDGVE